MGNKLVVLALLVLTCGLLILPSLHKALVGVDEEFSIRTVSPRRKLLAVVHNKTARLVVPPHAKAGDTVQFQTSDGTVAKIQIPNGVVPGQAINVQIPILIESTARKISMERERGEVGNDSDHAPGLTEITGALTSISTMEKPPSSSFLVDATTPAVLPSGGPPPTPSPTCRRGECVDPEETQQLMMSKAAKKRLGKETAAKAAKQAARAQEEERKAAAVAAAAAVSAALADAEQKEGNGEYSTTPLSYVASCFEPQCAHAWRDSSSGSDNGGLGQRIEAHGGGMLRDEKRGLWFWYGEGAKVGEGGRSLSIRAYVSAKLGGPWHSLGHALTATEVIAGLNRQHEAQANKAKKALRRPEEPQWRTSASDLLDFPRGSVRREQLILERPKVLYNAGTNKYVMWLHLDATHSSSSKSSSRSSKSNSGSTSGSNNNNNKERAAAAVTASTNGAASTPSPGASAVLPISGPAVSASALEGQLRQDRQRRRRLGGGFEAVLADELDTIDRDRHEKEEEADDDEKDTKGEGMEELAGFGDNDAGQLAVVDSLQEAEATGKSGFDSTRFEEGGEIGKLQKYWVRRAAVAVSDSPEGPFTFVHALRPDGRASLDLQLFQEDDDDDKEGDEAEGSEDGNERGESGVDSAAAKIIGKKDEGDVVVEREDGIDPRESKIPVTQNPENTAKREKDHVAGKEINLQQHLPDSVSSPGVIKEKEVRVNSPASTTMNSSSSSSSIEVNNSAAEKLDTEEINAKEGEGGQAKRTRRLTSQVTPQPQPPEDKKNFSNKKATSAVAAKAYLIRSVDNLFVGISRLTDDYLNTTSQGIVSTYRPALEGMAVFKLPNGTYYALLSHMTGWEPNPMVLLRAQGKSLEDPRWVFMGNPTHDPRSFNSQPAFVVKVRDNDFHRNKKLSTSSSSSSPDKKGGDNKNRKSTGSRPPYFVMMADNWVRAGEKGLADAGYVWLPLSFTRSSVRLQRLTNWSTHAPFKTCRWENASELHALATSAHASTLPWAGNKHNRKSGGSAGFAGVGGVGESWSALGLDPQDSWCEKGFVYRGDSPYCCSAVCGPGCGELPPTSSSSSSSLIRIKESGEAAVGRGGRGRGGGGDNAAEGVKSVASSTATMQQQQQQQQIGPLAEGCALAREVAVNGSAAGSSSFFTSALQRSAAQIDFSEALVAARLSPGGQQAWAALASSAKCCPSDIGNRPCESAADTACVLERAPTSSSPSSSSRSVGGSGKGSAGVQSPLSLEWTPWQFDKLSEKAQKKAEKAALLRKIDATFFKSGSSSASGGSSSSSSSSSLRKKSSTTTVATPTTTTTAGFVSPFPNPATTTSAAAAAPGGGGGGERGASNDAGFFAVTAVAVPSSAALGTVVANPAAAAAAFVSLPSATTPVLFDNKPPTASPRTAKEKRVAKEREKEALLASIDKNLFKDRPIASTYAATTAFKNLQAGVLPSSASPLPSNSDNYAPKRPPPHPIWSAKMLLDKTNNGGGATGGGVGGKGSSTAAASSAASTSTSSAGTKTGSASSGSSRASSLREHRAVDLGVGGLETTAGTREVRPVAPDVGAVSTRAFSSSEGSSAGAGSGGGGGGGGGKEKTQPWQWNKPWKKKPGKVG